MRRLPALVAAVVATVVMAPTPAHAAGMVWPVGPSPSSDAEDQPCASLLFVGVRGSGEPIPYGDTVTRVRNNLRLATSTTRGTVREVWVDYPAANPHTLSQTPMEQLLLGESLPETVYYASVRQGADSVARVLDDASGRCPAERAVVAGFSQGAEVATLGLARASTIDHVAGVVVAGNPANAPHLPGGRVGTAADGAFGLSASLYYVRTSIALDREKASPNTVAATLQSALELRDRTARAEVLAASAHAEATEIPKTLGDGFQTACLSEDLACDAGPALSRVMAAQSTLPREIDDTRVIHLSYNEDVLRPATDVVARRIAASVTDPRPTGGAGVVPRGGSRWWLGLAAGGLFAAGLGLGLLLRRPGRRRGSR